MIGYGCCNSLCFEPGRREGEGQQRGLRPSPLTDSLLLLLLLLCRCSAGGSSSKAGRQAGSRRAKQAGRRAAQHARHGGMGTSAVPAEGWTSCSTLVLHVADQVCAGELQSNECATGPQVARKYACAAGPQPALAARLHRMMQHKQAASGVATGGHLSDGCCTAPPLLDPGPSIVKWRGEGCRPPASAC